jgi:glycosyltransferase involved in cell wall biosynthesis
VLLDITRLLYRKLRHWLPTGVDRVGLEYVRRFRRGARALVRYRGRWLILKERDSDRMFDALLEHDPASNSAIRRCVGRALALQWTFKRIPRVLFNFDHSGLEDPAYAKRVRSNRLQPLFFLHDLIPVTHPEYCRPGQDEHHRRRVDTMLSVGRGLILNSAATQESLDTYTRSHHQRVPPCVVAPLAPSRLPPPSPQRPLAAAYFIVLGTIESRKNHLLVLHLWRKLVEEMGPNAPKLAVIGQRGWECEQVIDLLERCPALRGTVEQRESCNDAELSTWLFHAQALLYPSFVEGYGIPIIEALTLGLPVIASDLPVFREVSGKPRPACADTDLPATDLGTALRNRTGAHGTGH